MANGGAALAAARGKKAAAVVPMADWTKWRLALLLVFNPSSSVIEYDTARKRKVLMRREIMLTGWCYRSYDDFDVLIIISIHTG